jgi:hypothetical protein
MQSRTLLRSAVTSAALLYALAVPAQQAVPPLNGPALSGTMIIDFGSRRSGIEGAASGRAELKPGVDRYQVDLRIGDATFVRGVIEREHLSGRPASIVYKGLDWGVLRDGKEMSVLTQSGVIPIDKDGVYQLDSTPDLQISPDAELRFKISAPSVAKFFPADQLQFSGSFKGKRPKSATTDAASLLGGWKNWIAQQTWTPQVITRTIGGRRVELAIARPDPMYFTNVRVPAGPLPGLQSAVINGDMVFDYDNAMWAFNNFNFNYTDGTRDTLSGAVYWKGINNGDGAEVTLSDGRRVFATGYYEFTVNFNEDKADLAKAGDAGDFFASLERGASASSAGNGAGLDDFFTQLDTAAGLSGKIYYNDLADADPQCYRKVADDGEDYCAPYRSETYYQINGSGVTKQQVTTFLKLWLLALGPVNDE